MKTLSQKPSLKWSLESLLGPFFESKSFDGFQEQFDLVLNLVYFVRMTEINIHEAKTNLSRLLSRVAAGEEIVIAKAGKPVARLVPFRKLKGRRPLGMDKGLFEVPEDFDAPLPDGLLTAFENEP